MSRKEVIKLLKLIKSTVYLGNSKFLDALEFAINYLNQPEQRWIPCSERLPEEYGVYRITWTTSALKKRFVCDAEYEATYEWDAKRNDFKGKWLLDDFIAGYYPNVKVIAWKPIEEPYAERREE
jgi:hypothetical protein